VDFPDQNTRMAPSVLIRQHSERGQQLRSMFMKRFITMFDMVGNIAKSVK